MMKVTEESLQYIVHRLISNAEDAVKESDANKEDKFNLGRRLAYYEMLDILKSELDIRDADLEAYGLDANIDAYV